MTKRFAIAAAVSVLFLAASQRLPDPVPTNEIRGVGLGLFASEPNYDYGQLVDEIDARGAIDVLLVVQWSQSSVWSHDVGPNEATVSTPALRRTIRQAHDAGLRVTLMPIVRLRERTPEQWRGTIKPDADAWFANYRSELDKLARVASAEGVERFIVGSELGSMQVHERPWRELIADVREVYDGRVTYSANWDNYELGFWDALDEVGVTGYFPVDADAPGQSWNQPLRDLAALSERIHKPLFLTEVGYPSHRLAAKTPWDQTADDQPAPELQADLYRGFCDAVSGTSLQGYFFWNWFGFGGPRDVSYTPRGKPAASQLERCLRR